MAKTLVLAAFMLGSSDALSLQSVDDSQSESELSLFESQDLQGIYYTPANKSLCPVADRITDITHCDSAFAMLNPTAKVNLTANATGSGLGGCSVSNKNSASKVQVLSFNTIEPGVFTALDTKNSAAAYCKNMTMVASLAKNAAALASQKKANSTAAAAAAAWFASPLYRIVQLLGNITAKVETEGNEQLIAYDKYSCWVEDKLESKTRDINAAKKLIGELRDDIVKLKGDTAARGADILQLKKDIADNQALQKSNTADRNKEKSDYKAKKLDLDASDYSLGTSIVVLSKGAHQGTSFVALRATTGLNQEVYEAELMSTASDINSFVQSSQGQSKLSDEQLETVRQFVQNPRSAFAQVDNENGDSQTIPSTSSAHPLDMILGIVKAMRDSVQGNLADALAEDTASEASFQSVLAVKKQGEAVLTNELTDQTGTQATDTQTLATSEKTRDTTKAQLAADEEFFADIKKEAIAKADEWNKVTRLRAQELLGLYGAVKTLSAAKNTFGEASLSKKSLEFLQLQIRNTKSSRHEMSLMEELTSSDKAIPKKQAMQVISKIDAMTAGLRKEEQDDIDNRDDCEQKMQANKNKRADIATQTKKAADALAATVLKIKTLRENLQDMMRKIAGTNKDMKDMTDQRNKENTAFRRALKVDKESAKVIGVALDTLTKFGKNKAKGGSYSALLQGDTDADGPQYTKSEKEQRPKAELGSDHGAETGGVVVIMEMMKEDFEKEMKEASNDEAEALSDYKAGMAALQKNLDAQMDAKGSFEKDLATAAKTKVKNENAVTQAANDFAAAIQVRIQLDKDCKWISDKTFEKRRAQRKSEMSSIAGAKDFLGDIMSGKPVLFFQAR